MSFWNRIIETISGGETQTSTAREVSHDASRYVFVDVEVGVSDKKIHDIGALRWDGAVYHSADKHELMNFLKDADFVCGHNIINHDARYLFGDEPAAACSSTRSFCRPCFSPNGPTTAC